ncbi:hypothetical protein ACFSCX_14490 [Bacillus salitolerans]|uniref:Uncharacterized protein n=1 Tax=Bacillus salitolerans TaxID=1437434 RepID=A0ABW4LTF4_9BACI
MEGNENHPKQVDFDPIVCESVEEDDYFWNELHTIVEDGVEASIEE